MTKRVAIQKFRINLEERNADSNFTNSFLYSKLVEHANWIIKREITSGRIYKNTSFFQTLKCQEVIESSVIDPCCPISTDCKIYRTKNKVEEMWLDNDGPVVKAITSVDSSTKFILTTPTTWQNKANDPYQKKSKEHYAFFNEGYLWFPEVNPHRINILGFFKDDVSIKNECSPIKECVRYLDTKFMIPDWIEAEMYEKAVSQMAGVTKRMPPDNEINKNQTRKD